MSSGELAYLSLVIGAVLVFMATLGWVSRRDGGRAKASARLHRLEVNQGGSAGRAVHSHR